MLQIDGSYNEGGGQILRTALAYSTLFQKPFEIINIRKGRPKPGLKNQHLYCIKALQQLCNAKVGGDELGSEKLRYFPNKISSTKIKVDIETAGSITLLLQSLLLPCLFSQKAKKIEIVGGTDVKYSPQIDYLKEIILPQLNKYAEKIELKLEKRGYYPKGGGKIILTIRPKYNLENLEDSPKIDLTEQGGLIQIKGISHASHDLQEIEVAERQLKSAKINLSQLKVPITIDAQYSDTLSTGSGITLWAVFSKEEEELGYLNPIKIGSDALGEKGKPSGDVGKEAAQKLIDEINSKAPVDQHLADNLIPFMGLIPGSEIKTSKITNHTLTNIYVVEQFLGKKFKVEGNTIKSI
ncbi:RNA 3'-phosphate cyclase [Candidatus Woesearchaeota archaeon B3_Woes]|nr:MAG: RNA 3'-phosphate cyclase [Candidatus Woesearchaeota archaeon B3_Woes]